MWSKNTIQNIFGVLFLLIGLAFFVLGCYGLVGSNNFLKSAIGTKGKITRLMGQANSGVLSPVFEFTTASGGTVDVLSTFGTNLGFYHVGDIINIRYQPDNPSVARIDTFGDIWGFPILSVSIGLLFTFISLRVIFINARSTKYKYWLLKNGTRILADYLNMSKFGIVIQGKSAYRINCQWLNPQNNTLYHFSSEYIWMGSNQTIKDNKIPVLINPNNPKQYYIDVSSLMKST